MIFDKRVNAYLYFNFPNSKQFMITINECQKSVLIFKIENNAFAKCVYSKTKLGQCISVSLV
jgi:hypothetical protein